MLTTKSPTVWCHITVMLMLQLPLLGGMLRQNGGVWWRMWRNRTWNFNSALPGSFAVGCRQHPRASISAGSRTATERDLRRAEPSRLNDRAWIIYCFAVIIGHITAHQRHNNYTLAPQRHPNIDQLVNRTNFYCVINARLDCRRFTLNDTFSVFWSDVVTGG